MKSREHSIEVRGQALGMAEADERCDIVTLRQGVIFRPALNWKSKYKKRGINQKRVGRTKIFGRIQRQANPQVKCIKVAEN